MCAENRYLRQVLANKGFYVPGTSTADPEKDLQIRMKSEDFALNKHLETEKKRQPDSLTSSKDEPVVNGVYKNASA